MTILRETLTDIADRERHEAEVAAKHVPHPEVVSHCFSVIQEFARRRIERIVAAEQKHETNGTSDPHHTVS
jgi:hypothetical protein